MATIKDVAAAAGLNVGTVSRIINNRGYISPKTRERVFDIMREMHYQPSEVARSLTKQRTNTLGLIVPQVSHPYFAKLIDLTERAASDRGYKLMLHNSRLDSTRMAECLELCKASRVDGVILLSREVDSSLFETPGLPVVSFERWPDSTAATVRCDNVQGGELAARCLIDGGCRQLLCFGDTGEVRMPAGGRITGFTKVCREAGVHWRAVETGQDDFLNMDYRATIGEALDKYPDTDGAFTGSDLIAAQLLQICAQRGLRVPEDLQIVGFDDVIPADLTIPTLTTIHQPLEEMVTAAMDLLEKMIGDEAVSPDTSFPVTLIRRGSTKGA